MADHITKPSITDLSYSAQPNKTVWALRTDGVLISITYNDLQNEVACARQTTDGMIESIAVIPNGGEDELWISVQRTVNGVVQRFIEYASPLHFNDLPDNWLFLDSQLQYKGPPSTTITGLDHWEGEAIDVLADKDYLGKLTVSGGSITLTKAASNVVAGKLYTSSFTTLPILTSPQTIGTKQKIGKLYLKLLNAFGVRVDGELIDFRGISGLNLAPTVTGDYRWTPSGGYDNESNFTLSVDRPFPATILGFGAHIDVLADKDYLGKLTVSGGSITLTKAASNVVAGKLYTSSFTTLPILTSPQTIGTKQKIGKLYLKLLNAFGVRVDGELIDFRGISGLNLAPTVTGDYRWTPSGGYDNESNFTLSVDRPFPATILGFGAHIDVS